MGEHVLPWQLAQETIDLIKMYLMTREIQKLGALGFYHTLKPSNDTSLHNYVVALLGIWGNKRDKTHWETEINPNKNKNYPRCNDLLNTPDRSQ